jgi:hypothetical protein
MAQRYIDLSRRFVELKAGQKLEAGWSATFGGISNYGLSWDEILLHSRVVILAETGMGKTAELKARAVRLREAGGEAFYLRLESLLDLALPEATDGAESRTRLDGWLTGSGPATFFLDSVDEAKLRSHDAFARALNKLSTGLGKAHNRARIIVTSRPSPDWDDEVDRAHINSIFPPPKDAPPMKPIKAGDGENTSVLEWMDDAPAKQKSFPLVVGLLQLGSEQNEMLAKSLDVQNLDDFLKAVHSANASEFLGRPADVIDLLEEWKERGALGSLREILEATIRRRLRQNPKRPEVSSLDLQSSRVAAETLAATLVLSRRGTVAGWDSPADTAVGSVDARDCLSDWTPLDIHALLVRPLFEMESFGQLRFARRSFREYLFATWLIRLLDHGAPLSAILPLIIGEAYGVRSVLPYVAESAAWLGQIDDRAREAILAAEPMILLQAGDPSLLPLDERKKLLKEYVRQFQARPNGRLSIDIKMVQRLVSSEMGPAIAQHLKAHPGNKPIQDLMLRLAWQGNLPEVWPEAMKILLDNDADEYARTVAMRVIAESKSAVHLKKLAAGLLKNATHFDAALTGEALSALYPGYLSSQQLLKVLTRIEPPKRFTVGVNYAIEKMANALPSGKPSEDFVGVVLRLLQHAPYIDHAALPISARHKWLLATLGDLLKRELGRPGKHVAVILDAVEIFCVGTEYDPEARKDTAALRKAIQADRSLSLEFFWRAVRRTKAKFAANGTALNDFWQVHELGEPWSLEAVDFEPLAVVVETSEDAVDRSVALTAALSVLLDRTLGSAGVVRLQAAAAAHPALAARLAQLLTDGPKTQQRIEFEKMERKHQRDRTARAKKEKQGEETFIKRIKANAVLMARPGRSATAEGFHDLIAITHWLNRNSSISRYADLDLDKARQVFGDAAIDGYVAGIKSYWRHYKTQLKSDGANFNETTYGSIVALPGLTAEAAADARWPAALTAQDAELALRHALVELNGFPSWFDKLVVAFPEDARALVRGEVEWEWDHTGEECPYYVLADLVHATPVIREIFASDIFALLQSRLPHHKETLRRALQIICASPIRVKPSFSSLCRQKLLASTEVGERARWLTAWLIVDSAAALDWIWAEVARLGPADGDLLVGHLLSDLFDTHGQNLGQIQAVETANADQLAQLVRLSFRHVRPQDDIQHDDVYSPGVRDRAEDARRYFTEKLAAVKGRSAYAALRALAEDKAIFSPWMREHFVDRAFMRASVDAEPSAWVPSVISVFAHKHECEPDTLADLMAIVMGRLGDISYALDNGDFSERDNVRSMTKEVEAQRWLASKLRETARGMYSVTREEEVIARKETDIRVHHAKAGALTIEIKLADKWTYEQLQTGYSKQLIGQYLRDRRGQAGIYLLIHRGVGRKSWLIAKKKNALPSVVETLRRKTRVPAGRLVTIVTMDVCERR